MNCYEASLLLPQRKRTKVMTHKRSILLAGFALFMAMGCGPVQLDRDSETQLGTRKNALQSCTTNADCQVGWSCAMDCGYSSDSGCAVCYKGTCTNGQCDAKWVQWCGSACGACGGGSCGGCGHDPELVCP